LWYVDCNADIATCSTGHCHPQVVEAIQKQTEILIHIGSFIYCYRQMSNLAKKTCYMYYTKRQRFIS